MDDNAIHEWLIKCFGPIQGEMAWQQISQLPEEIREQLMSQDPSRLPNPSEVQQMMAAFSAGGLNTMGDMQRTVEEGPINVKLAKSIALQQANASGSASSVSAVDGETARRAMSEANLWLDTACEAKTLHVANMDDELTVRFRVGGVYKNCYISTYLNDQRIICRKRPVMAPGEMEQVKLQKSVLEAMSDLDHITIKIEEEA